jgi:hypothetical protein
MRYVDANGVAGNLITVIQKFPGSSTQLGPSDWWLYGNQQPVDTSIRPFIRLNEQLAPNQDRPSSTHLYAVREWSGYLHQQGRTPQHGSARCTGQRTWLPTAGVVLTRPDLVIVTDTTSCTFDERTD